LKIIIGLLEALEVLHDKRWAHCDVQPANVLVDDSVPHAPRVTLIDFGACLRVTDRHSVGEKGEPRCWEYSAPEQWRRQPVDQKTDVFGAAGVLFYLLSGHTVFPDSDKKDGADYKEKAGTVTEEFDKYVAGEGRSAILDPTLNDAQKHYLWHECLRVDGDPEPRGLRHVLWRALGLRDVGRAEMKEWLERILASKLAQWP
jgi:serine/threonine protein kinase